MGIGPGADMSPCAPAAGADVGGGGSWTVYTGPLGLGLGPAVLGVNAPNERDR